MINIHLNIFSYLGNNESALFLILYQNLDSSQIRNAYSIKICLRKTIISYGHGGGQLILAIVAEQHSRRIRKKRI